MSNSTLIPELRFPDFESLDEWDIIPLGSLSELITEKTKGKKYVLMSITSGVGLVSQLEKFGREIAGNSYNNYYVIQNGDFAYNKSSTKLFAQGEIAMYEGETKGAVPNSIFTCFRFKKDRVYPIFAKYPFHNNIHGNWLKSFIAIGARANGALQVNNKDLFSVPFPVPTLIEQKKIAACLSSLDEVIAAHSEKLEALKAHKKGLMQNLFPQEGKTVPKFRFPEFAQDGEWVKKKLGDVFLTFSGGTPSTSEKEYYGGSIPFIRSAEISKSSTELYLTNQGLENSSAKMVSEGDLLVALYGANSGDVAISQINGAINQAILCLRSEFSNAYVCQFLAFRKDWIISRFIQGGQGNLSGDIIKSIEVPFPSKAEQQKIALFLSALDATISAQTEKIDQLKQHKQGLMQGLFPKMEG